MYDQKFSDLIQLINYGSSERDIIKFFEINQKIIKLSSFWSTYKIRSLLSTIANCNKPELFRYVCEHFASNNLTSKVYKEEIRLYFNKKYLNLYSFYTRIYS